MSTFVNYLKESKFRKLDDEELDQVEYFANTYYSKARELNPITKRLRGQNITKDEEWQEYFGDANITHLLSLGSIKYKDLETEEQKSAEVLVAYGDPGDTNAMFDDSENIIFLFDDNIKHLPRDEVASLIVHELTHGLQQYKKRSERYGTQIHKMIKGQPYSKKAYYLAPHELDAQTTEIGHAIQTKFNSLLNDISKSLFPQTKKIMQRKLEKFLLELKNFIRSPIKNYLILKELPLPEPLDIHVDFLKTAYKDPKVYKKLKQKLVDLHTKFEKVYQEQFDT